MLFVRFGLAIAILVVGVFMVTQGAPVSLDAKPFYTGEQARALLELLGADGRELYRKTEIADLFFLTLYTAYLFLAFRGRSAAVRIAGFAPGLFDLIETSLILYALSTAIDQPYWDWLGIVTALKWVSGVPAVILLIARRPIDRREH